MKTLSTGWVALLTAALLLSACGGGSSQRTSTDNREHARLEYSFPYDTQQEVSPRAPLALRFSHPLTDTAPESAIQWQDEDGNVVAFSAEAVDNGRGLLLTPDQVLKSGTGYELSLGAFNTSLGEARVPEGIHFRTRAALSGGRQAMTVAPDGENGFVLNRMLPDGDALPVMDFSSFRLQFSQPLARDSVRYGDTMSVSDSNGDLVPMTVLVKGPYLTLDPQEDLQPGTRYTFSLEAGLRSVFGTALTATSFSHVARDSAPREIMVQRADDSQNGAVVSPLTGAPINGVPVNALLLGDRASSQQQGDIHAELAFVPNYPEVTPLRVPRGSLLRGSSVTVEIAGEVPAGFETGEIGVRFVSDAMGFLLPNRYTQAEDSPRHVQLLMDVAMTAENPEANGALSQDLLHLELAGTAIVEDGLLVINAIGVVEPEVLGLERAWGVLSFRLEAYADQENAPSPEIDSEPPVLQSWVPGERIQQVKGGDPIILNFSESLDPASLEDAVTVTVNGVPASEMDWYLDGASLVLRPEGGLAYNTDYEISLSEQITDLAGNALMPETLAFRTATYVGTGDRAPFAMTAYPGFPCAIREGTADLLNDIQGSCLTKESGWSAGDLLPVARLPANRGIRVRFSQTMDAASIRVGESCDSGTFRVERVSDAGACEEAVPGNLSVTARGLVFEPDAPWQEGVLYRYVLVSAGAPDCSAGTICSASGAPLQTAMLRENGALEGGPPMQIYFRGASESGDVMQVLANLPTADVNANFVLDEGEQGAVEDENGQYPTPANAAQVLENSGSGLVGKVNVGCGFSGIGNTPRSCPGEKFIYITGALDVDIIGWDEQEGAVRVLIYPTLLMTSSVTVYATIVGISQEIPTGPQVMRLRYQADENGDRTQPITGWIRQGPDGPEFDVSLDLFLDAPYLHPPLGLPHNLKSYSLDGLRVSGPISFLEDGRMQIGLVSLNGMALGVDIGGIAGVNLDIPEGGINLTYISAPVKQ